MGVDLEERWGAARVVPPLDGVARPAEEDARSHYRAYRKRQATRLVHMLPEGAVRPLYRRARAEACRAGVPESRIDDDPLGILIHYCEELLPLPPYELWKRDLDRNPSAHFEDLADTVDQPTSDAPVTIESRTFDYGDRSWTALLRSFRDSGLWRAYIAFQEAGCTRVHRTATVFCEHDPNELRDRFLSFERAALQALLRSALP